MRSSHDWRASSCSWLCRSSPSSATAHSSRSWGHARRGRLEAAITTATVVPVTDSLLDTVAQLRFECRRDGHPLADRSHHQDLWIAAATIHIDAHLVTADGIFTDVPRLTLG